MVNSLTSDGEELSAKTKQVIEAYRNSISLIYRDTDVAKLPNPDLAEAVIKNYRRWDDSDDERAGHHPDSWGWVKAGAIFAGIPGRGKTRMAHLLAMHMLTMPEAFNPKAISAVAWGAEASRRAKACDLDGWVYDLLQQRGEWLDLLVIDDLDKLKVTETAQAQMFHLIEESTSNDVALIITTNVTGRELTRKLGPDYGPASVRRLNDFGTVINCNDS